jgi:D,D-heptose 1,7-bisphosphate phosphatase
VKDIGTHGHLAAVTADVRAGRVARRNLATPQQAVFLDRDGTINRDVGFLTDASPLELIEGVGKFVSAVNRAGYLAIVVTNQPVIARGDVTWAGLREIHDKMETLLGEHGAYVNDIFICPYHPDSGFAGERVEYKIACDCRKPRPGLLIAAAEKYNIDLAARDTPDCQPVWPRYGVTPARWSTGHAQSCGQSHAHPYPEPAASRSPHARRTPDNAPTAQPKKTAPSLQRA